jgi:RNA ligase-like protein
MEYPKIHSLWKREGWYFDEKLKEKTPHSMQGKRQSFIEGDHAEPEFAAIKTWRVDEKVDGTNIRILFNRAISGSIVLTGDLNSSVSFAGRTKDAQIPCHLLDYLQKKFTKGLLMRVFPEHPDIVLFGEGYGPKIQAVGGNYRKEPAFILFDIKIGHWWLKKDDVKEIAKVLEIDTVPDLGIMTEQEIIEFVKSKPLSTCSITPQMMEGVVCRSEPLMLYRDGRPIMWKLKCKEFI